MLKPWDSEVEDRDEVWRFVGLQHRFVLRKDGRSYRMVGRTEALTALMERVSYHKVEELVRTNDLSVQTINVC
jgi:hypothetical protein